MLAYISHKAGKPRVLNLHGATDVIVTSSKGSINPVPRELQIRNRPLLDMSQSNANQTIDKVAEQTKSFVSQAEEQGNKFFHDSKNYLQQQGEQINQKVPEWKEAGHNFLQKGDNAIEQAGKKADEHLPGEQKEPTLFEQGQDLYNRASKYVQEQASHFMNSGQGSGATTAEGTKEQAGSTFSHLSEQAQKYAHDAYEQVSHAFQGSGADASNAGSQISK